MTATKIKFADAKRDLRAIDMDLTRSDFDPKELRVAFRGDKRAEASAYYTTDLEDAVKTGRAMHKRRSRV